jgi:hypothetical protein
MVRAFGLDKRDEKSQNKFIGYLINKLIKFAEVAFSNLDFKENPCPWRKKKP